MASQSQITNDEASAQNTFKVNEETIIPNRVFVGGLSPTTMESDLVDLFSTYGNVIAANVVTFRSGVPKGYGFVTFDNNNIIAHLRKSAGNLTLHGRKLHIAPARSKQPYLGGFEAQEGWDVSQAVGAHGDIRQYMVQPETQRVTVHENGLTYEIHNGTAFFNQPTSSNHSPNGSHSQLSGPTTECENGIAYVRHRGMAFFNQSPPPTAAPVPNLQGEASAPAAEQFYPFTTHHQVYQPQLYNPYHPEVQGVGYYEPAPPQQAPNHLAMYTMPNNVPHSSAPVYTCAALPVMDHIVYSSAQHHLQPVAYSSHPASSYMQQVTYAASSHASYTNAQQFVQQTSSAAAPVAQPYLQQMNHSSGTGYAHINQPAMQPVNYPSGHSFVQPGTAPLAAPSEQAYVQHRQPTPLPPAQQAVPIPPPYSMPAAVYHGQHNANVGQHRMVQLPVEHSRAVGTNEQKGGAPASNRQQQQPAFHQKNRNQPQHGPEAVGRRPGPQDGRHQPPPAPCPNPYNGGGPAVQSFMVPSSYSLPQVVDESKTPQQGPATRAFGDQRNGRGRGRGRTFTNSGNNGNYNGRPITREKNGSRHAD